MVIKLF